MGENKKILLVAIDMGYGHQRTAFPLRGIAYQNRVINANNYLGMPVKDKRLWKTTRGFYEFISDFKKIPLVGESAFRLFDKFQKIPAFYPRRDLSHSNFSLNRIFAAIRKGWGRDFVEKLEMMNRNGESYMPIVSTFFTPAFMAEYFNYPGNIFCVVCDADVSRAWVSINPAKSRIKYLAPNSWVRDRLKLYGVKASNIFLSGYPLPAELIGESDFDILKEDVKRRILNLDPTKRYQEHYDFLIKKYLGDLPKESGKILTILFSIGGAGAQKEIAFKFLRSLASMVRKEKIKIILSCGTRENVREYFLTSAKKIYLGQYIGKGIELVYEREISRYFKKFNQKLREADILWTKPSELSFYSGLGLPIIMAPTVGSQEDFNRRWLSWIGAAFPQENPVYASQWLPDLLTSGRLAEAALEGFIEVEKQGVYNIKRICLG